MIEIEVTYDGRTIPLQCNLNENMKEIFIKFCSKAIVDINSIYFIYNGNVINDNSSLELIINQFDKERKKMTILSVSKDEQINKEKKRENDSFVKAEQVICPKCGEISKINIKDYIINLYGCKNNHSTENILLENFEETQKIDESKIICGDCNAKNKKNAYHKLFYFCWHCKINLCPLCKETHKKDHYIEDYNMKNYICPDHGDNYYSYCQTCDKNLCIGCENEHLNHNKINFGTILPKKNELNNHLIELNNYIEDFKKEVNLLKEKLNFIVDNMDNYFRLVKDIYNSWNIKKRNFEILNNISEIKTYSFYVEQKLKIINTDTDIISKFKNIINIFNLIKNNYKNEEKNIINNKTEIIKNDFNSICNSNNYKNVNSNNIIYDQNENNSSNDIFINETSNNRKYFNDKNLENNIYNAPKEKKYNNETLENTKNNINKEEVKENMKQNNIKENKIYIEKRESKKQNKLNESTEKIKEAKTYNMQEEIKNYNNQKEIKCDFESKESLKEIVHTLEQKGNENYQKSKNNNKGQIHLIFIFNDNIYELDIEKNKTIENMVKSLKKRYKIFKKKILWFALKRI